MEIIGFTDRIVSAMTMPLSGTITQVLSPGHVGQLIPDSLEKIGFSYRFVPNVGAQITFDATASIDAMKRLNDESREWRESLEKFQESFGILSELADNPFRLMPSDDFIRTKNCQAFLLSTLWTEDLLQLRTEETPEKYPVLENRVSRLLDDRKIAFLANLLSISESDARGLASEVLANKVREKLLPPVPEILHPTAPFQKLKINDPVLYAKHTVSLSMDGIMSLRNFSYNAIQYWQAVSDTKLYNKTDIEALKAWGVIRGNPFKTTDGSRIIYDDIPFDKLKNAHQELYQVTQNLDEDIKIINEIAYLGFIHFLNSDWPKPTEVHPEERSRWVAKCAAVNLGLAVEVAERHAHVFSEIIPFIMRQIEFRNENQAKVAVSGDGASPLPWIYSDSEFFASVVVKYGVSDFICERIAYTVKGIYGGCTIKLYRAMFSDSDMSNISEPDRDTATMPDTIRIYQELLENPKLFEEKVNYLRALDNAYENFYSRKISPELDIVLGKAYRFNKSRLMLDKHRKNSNAIFVEIEKVRMALSQVEKINAVESVFSAAKQKINGTNIINGNISVPIDHRLQTLLTSQGEFVPDGKTVALTYHCYKCEAKSFLPEHIFSKMPLTPMSVWKISIDGISDIASDIAYCCIVRKVTIDSAEIRGVTMELFATVDISSLEIQNLQKILPLSGRFKSLLHSVTDEVLNKVEHTLTQCTQVNIEFIKPLF